MSSSNIVNEIISRGSVESVKFKWLWGEITLSPADVLSYNELSDHLSEILNQAFVERWVMHANLENEDPDECIESLRENAAYLKEKTVELRGKLSHKPSGLVQILEELRSACVVNAREIEEAYKDVQEGNKYEIALDDRLRPKDWLPEHIIKLRLTTYPLFKVLIEFLPDNLTKPKAMDYWYAGRSYLAEKDKDQATGLWEVIPLPNQNKTMSPDIKKWWQFWK